MNNSGIYSLAGFAYQIKVFICYLTKLQDNCVLGYETYDDVALQKSDKDCNAQEEKLQTYNGLCNSPSGVSALQVKRAKLSNDDYEKVLFNWIILLKSSPNNINSFSLIVDKSYGNIDSVFPDDLSSLYDKIIKSKKKSNALITKVKKIIDNDFSLFSQLCQAIKLKYQFIEIENIDDLIYDNYKAIFTHGGVNDITYQLRIKELIKKFNYEILTSILENNSYTCDYNTFKAMVEDVNSRIKDNLYVPSFSEFRKCSKLNINDTDIVKSRQYIQLSKCSVGAEYIREQLIFEEYYNHYKLRCLENLRTNIVEDLEYTTHDNYESTKSNLIANNIDTPNNRLIKTQEKSNSYASNDQIRKGSAIHLTKSNTDSSLLISWEDET